MSIIRRLFLGLSIPLLTLLVFTAGVLLSLNVTFGKPDNPKRWLRESKLYDNIVPTIIKQSNQAKPADSGGVDDFARPEVQAALGQSVSPVFLQQSAENVLDGTYGWLEGKTDKPVYSIDLTGVKTAFASNLATTARNRLASLTPCSPANPPSSNDPLTTNCRPPTSVSEPKVQQLVNDIVNGEDFLPQNTITADTTSLGKESSTERVDTNQTPSRPWYQEAQKLPTIYAWAMSGPIILGAVALILGVGIIFAGPTRRKGIKALAIAMLSTGLLLSIGAAVWMVVFGRVSQSIEFKPETASLKTPVLYLLKAASNSLSMVQLWWGAGLAILAIATLVVLYITRPKNLPDQPIPQAPHTPPHQPLPPLNHRPKSS